MNRLTWVDNLRGMSVLAVIFLHSTIAVNGNAGHLTGVTETVNHLLSPVRLGLMFFVSGLFVESGLKKGFNLFVKNKVKSILYPFIIWVAIYGGLKLLFSSVSNNPQSPTNIILSHLTGGGDITWFLHSLFIFFLIIPWVRKVPFYIVIPVSLAFSFLLPAIPTGSVFSGFDNDHINRSFYLFTFFYLGDMLVKHQVDIPAFIGKKSVLLPSLACFIVLSSLNLVLNRDVAWQLLAPLALCSIPLFIFVALYANLKLVHFVGMNSIVFYLSHYLAIQVFAKAVKFTSKNVFINDLKFIAAFACALLLPLAICWLRRRGMLNFLFTLKPAAQSVYAR
ncbi:acyltransferase family protein [Erwinia tasmaniensis]|uniref:Predicted acyltransferase 3 n=1 Tax=Erwinia tasmaniensis (strain DSM 17950 / CFBP 7177 / CIP 109463 / NCPPB 4357 / Et1/99) TaxID=465817 RepID=B2VJE1_ERWT9|nr:acyltransferase [Erwinia tasmaniensis]CAO96483.1 Predicted acyltransferase 3 [Erwinia tasmaniensis Et1/99]